MKRPEVCFGV